MLLRFAHQFHNILIYTLLAAAGITALLSHYVDTLVILAVVLINAVIGFVQEGKAEQALDAIRHLLAPRAAVIREGARTTVDGEDLVPGDLVLLEAGDKVPADMRLVSAHDLRIQESILTGESIAVDKQEGMITDGASLGDRTNMAFSGTLVVSGQGRGVVVATGATTEIGHISGLIADVQTLTTPLVEQMDRFAKWLTLFIVSVSLVMLGAGSLFSDMGFSALFIAVVAFLVSAIPEGLPAVLTITLAVGVQVMARRKAIVRRLPAIETIGSVSVICTDKTGTLTRNEMSVATVQARYWSYQIADKGYDPSPAPEAFTPAIETEYQQDLTNLALVAALCNDAEVQAQGSTWQVEGDPMEGALKVLAGKIGLDRGELKQDWQRIDAIPFDARHKYMATLVRNGGGVAHILAKGAPEAILDLCQQQSGNGSDEPLDLDYWREQAEQIAAEGQRVLALAWCSADAGKTAIVKEDMQGALVLLGLVGLIDPPRPEAIEAVAECRAAGISIKMITGDHAATASAIASRIGLQYPDAVITGAELEQLSDEELVKRIATTDVFARTTPEHKLRLVTALQSLGQTVAMTGDGVNDAPALKRADVGIAMGLKGSEAAKEASALVLADDNFASIAAAVREGRTVYDNIKKVISWTLPTSAGESATIVLALLLGMSLPITPIQILWVNMITAVTLGIALAFEPTERFTMKRPPRPRDEPILGGELIWHVILVGALFLGGIFGIYLYALDRGYSELLAQAMAMNTLVVMKIFHLFFIRNIYGTSLNWRAVMGTPAVWIAVVVVTMGQFAITYAPFMQAIFATEAIPFIDGVLIVGVGVVLFVLIEMEKQIRLRFFYRQRPQAVARV